MLRLVLDQRCADWADAMNTRNSVTVFLTKGLMPIFATRQVPVTLPPGPRRREG